MIRNKSHQRFIVIDGIDAVGKTTIAKRLSNILSAQYYKTPPAIFEQFTEANDSCNLRQFVDSMAHNMPQTRFLFYLFGLSVASQEIEKLLTNRSVVCDRYLASTLAYHWALDANLENADIDWLSILKPDFEFLLVIKDKKKYEKRLRDKQKNGTASFLEKDTKYMYSVQDNFRKLNLIEIDVSQSTVEEIVRLLIMKINE